MALTEQQQQSLLGVTSFMFDYAPDQASYDRFASILEQNPSFYDLGTDLAKTDAFQSQYDGTTQGLIDLVFNRLNITEGTQAYTRGTDFITQRLEAGVSEGQVLMEVGEKLLQDTPPEGLEDAAAILQNKIAVSQAYLESGVEGYSSETIPDLLSNVTADQASVEAAQEKIDNLPTQSGGEGETFTLTGDIDVVNGTAGDDRILGQEDTADAADQIDGGAGRDTLELYNVTSDAVPNNVSNVEQLSVIGANTAGAAGATAPVNVVAGEYEQVWAKDGSSVAVTELSNDQTIGIDGVATISGAFTGNTANVALDDANGTATLTGAAVRTINVSGNTANNATATLAGAATAATTTLNVAAAGDVALNSAAALALETVSVSGEGEVDLGTLAGTVTSLDASENTGGVTATVSNAAVNVTGSQGDDVITLGANLGGKASIDLGAGDDVLLSGGNALGSQGADGGEGTDTIAASLITAGSVSNIENFEVLALDSGTDLDLGLIDGVESLELRNGSNATLSNVALDQSLSIAEANAGNTTTLDFASVTGDEDTYSVSFNAENNTAAAVAVDAGIVVVDGVENIELVSGSAEGETVNTIELDGDSAETVTISGDQDLNLTFAATFGDDTTTDTTGVTAIDASAATGDVDIDLANVVADTDGLAVTGGSGDDTLTTAGSSVSLTGGEGEDTFEVAANTGADSVVSITDMEEGDTIDFGALASGNFASEALDVSSATTLNAALGLADESANDVSWFEYGNNTYVVAADATTADNTGDTIVKLTGSVDLSEADFAAGELTIA